jgi:Flp pilus assembly pilin Flp
MVGHGLMQRFLREERGATLVEGMIAVPVVLLVITAMIEFSYAVWQWNQTVKAVQLGARLAAVSTPVPTNLDGLTADFTGLDQGNAVPNTYVAVTCGADAAACDTDELNRLVMGSDGVCNPFYGSTVPGICDFNPNIQPENIRITYHRSYLGYIGRPAGPVATVTLEVRDLRFNLPFIGRFVGINTIDIPAHPVSITSEDLNSCQDSC